MLNHTEEFKLDETSIESDLLLNWYDINPKGTPLTFTADQIFISQWNSQLFFNDQTLFQHAERITGIAVINDIIAIALQFNVLLVDTDGEIIELIRVNTNSPIINIASHNNRVALLNKNKILFLSDTHLTAWKPHKTSLDLNWSTQSTINDQQMETLKKAYRGNGLNLEKVILDLHSGRIFNNSWGVYIMDATAILMMLLGISGTWVWWSRKLKMKKKKHYRKHH